MRMVQHVHMTRRKHIISLLCWHGARIILFENEIASRILLVKCKMFKFLIKPQEAGAALGMNAGCRLLCCDGIKSVILMCVLLPLRGGYCEALKIHFMSPLANNFCPIYPFLPAFSLIDPGFWLLGKLCSPLPKTPLVASSDSDKNLPRNIIWSKYLNILPCWMLVVVSEFLSLFSGLAAYRSSRWMSRYQGVPPSFLYQAPLLQSTQISFRHSQLSKQQRSGKEEEGRRNCSIWSKWKKSM